MRPRHVQPSGAIRQRPTGQPRPRAAARSGAVLPAAAVADLLVALGTLARLIETPARGGDHRWAAGLRLARMRTVLAAIGIRGDQTPSERVASVRRACSRRRVTQAVYPSGVAR